MTPARPIPRLVPGLLALVGLLAPAASAWAADAARPIDFAREVLPVLETHCYRCHGKGSKKGGVALDKLVSNPNRAADHEDWLAVWRNLRAQTMPPSDKEQPGEAQRNLVIRWIERDVFQLDPAKPDPGRVTIRRLNRQEYRNTILDLFGVEFDATEAFPPDDTGYGFDTIGDVLSLSPLLVEKYLEAAQAVVGQIIHQGPARVPTLTLAPEQFRSSDGKRTARSLPFATPATVEHALTTPHSGPHRLQVELRVTGADEATSHTADLVVRVNGAAVQRRDLGWDFNKSLVVRADVTLQKGKNAFALELVPKEPPRPGEDALSLSVRKVELQGPLDGSFKETSPAYRRVFLEGPPPTDLARREAYARRILRHVADRAFRRPVDEATLDRLVALALDVARRPGKAEARFEQGIAQALTALLTSPRFLFRAEIQPEPNNPGRVVRLDEFALASRLSYFLWSSLPDEELFRLARAGKLRANLRAQIERMLADPKAERFVDNFVGQWLQTRDVETLNVDARRILGLKTNQDAQRFFNRQLRQAMREETEQLFLHLLRENGSALDLLTADYTFLNEALARFYGIPGVQGNQMRKVALPSESHRGGILTHASVLLVTSNPTRTSPVKRGLFVLENLLGTPAPPPPPDVPPLEEAARGQGRSLSMREVLAIHRAQPLCASCHARMDPLGLALEEYNALGMWREQDNGKPIDTAGQLITGEKFANVRGLSQVIATARRRDYYRCLTEKMLTYAIGRGVEYYDAPTIEAIADALERDGGRLRTLVLAIVESAPFQMRRGDGERGAEP